jgi:hypothetical protein
MVLEPMANLSEMVAEAIQKTREREASKRVGLPLESGSRGALRTSGSRTER